MELEIIRTYHIHGTNGKIYVNGRFQCYSIELPWLNNQRRISCIPEGRYGLRKRYSQKFGQHLLVEEVEDRSEILIHPANDALKELKGCIAPVSNLSGEGKGSESKAALEKILIEVNAVIEREPIFLTIKNNYYEHQRKDTIANTEVL